jgi:hypothetical protein
LAHAGCRKFFDEFNDLAAERKVFHGNLQKRIHIHQ